MTADEKLKLLKAFQNKKALAGAGVILIEGPSAEALRTPNALAPRIHVILHLLDQAKSYWFESTLTKEAALQLPKVGVQVSNPMYVCLVGLHAAFVGAVATPAMARGTLVENALEQASIALKELSQELKPDELSLQMAMQRENQVFSSVSNVLKTRHDTAKNSISNIR